MNRLALHRYPASYAACGRGAHNRRAGRIEPGLAFRIDGAGSAITTDLGTGQNNPDSEVRISNCYAELTALDTVGPVYRLRNDYPSTLKLWNAIQDSAQRPRGTRRRRDRRCF